MNPNEMNLDVYEPRKNDHIKEMCGICLDACSLPYSLPCKHVFCYMCIKHTHQSCNKMCPLCRAIVPDEIMSKAVTTEESSVCVAMDVVWQYESKSIGNWWFYTKELNDKIENAWNHNEECALPIFGKEYEIDFHAMMQISPDGMRRRIRRVNSAEDINSTKGIAGLIFKDRVER